MSWPHDVIGADKFFSVRKARSQAEPGEGGHFLRRAVQVRGGREQK